MFPTSSFVVDVHSHFYPERYISLLRSRKTSPRITENNQLLILPSEDTSSPQGRPIRPEYSDMDSRLNFMNTHAIDHSIISLANPWVSFLDSDEARKLSSEINCDLFSLSSPRISAFGCLPISVPDIVEELGNIKRLGLKGVILGTSGVGKGLDDPDFLPVFSELERLGIIAFIHPHFGVGDIYGDRNNGHVLPLALGFPFETTVAVTRLILSGTFDKFPKLKILLAHSGGVLPYLYGRIDSCVMHDPQVNNRLKELPSYYLKNNFFYDAVGYSQENLELLRSFVGDEGILFGTDYPFFPPLNSAPEWQSVNMNKRAISSQDSEFVLKAMGRNAEKIFDLT
ncbi:2-amino-3-carboxymuconate-6-semialdehyde decarboxylase [Neolecta irregularis DAH-3]|uniref:2-amino-3-carboxymuconate-6-semialdehyde decarboxylase n=1 Tax=Neolecta irregularis (strain DAH-3) TaxID=1198029 RepID=A0A1U7LPV8_NEOID|nr:2-amino-3-carboxymuconate-6-semialdehyde decarboxylase [Neolecta irregularis DAH-3]|eukprot:OLL24706.1 2-amino-3-carboxymuconate-6-semialdehyde decarboxylase [Neolecta irregularis DAH-3]